MSRSGYTTYAPIFFQHGALVAADGLCDDVGDAKAHYIEGGEDAGVDFSPMQTMTTSQLWIPASLSASMLRSFVTKA